MKKKESHVTQLREEIMKALKLVNKTNSPQIQKRIQTESGYRWVESEIISMVLSTGQAPAECIPQIESEL